MRLPKALRILALLLLAALIAAGVALLAPLRTHQPIKVGVLHSLTGTMASSEKPLVDALQLAFDEINEAGGLLGRPVQPVIVDCRSDADICAREAERLITGEHVSALFGCWTSTCRKAVKVVVERHDHLLFYPLQYEGMELSPNIVYIGSTPNQQIIPAVRWALDNLGQTFYLVGSDYVFPRTANLIIKDLIESQGGKIVGERYLPLGSDAIAPVINDLKKLHPAVVLNTINGDTNSAFFTEFNRAGLTSREMPVISFSMAEAGFSRLPAMAGHYAAWGYFQSLQNEENQTFVNKIKQRFGSTRAMCDPMISSYTAVQFWKQAVMEAHTTNPEEINSAILHQSYASPGGIMAIGAATRHTWRTSRIGRSRTDGQFDIVWTSPHLIGPEPFPAYRTRMQWQRNMQGKIEP